MSPRVNAPTFARARSYADSCIRHTARTTPFESVTSTAASDAHVSRLLLHALRDAAGTAWHGGLISLPAIIVLL
jgi:hypothetical protein